MIEVFTNIMSGLQIRTKLNQMVTYLNLFISGNPSETNSANNNTFWGKDAGLNNEGTGNTFIGTNTGKYNKAGYSNTGVGDGSLLYNIDGHENCASGKDSQRDNKHGHRNTSQGNHSLFYKINGNYDTCSGFESLRGNLFGQRNTFHGYKSGQLGKFLDSNTSYGYKSGQSLDAFGGTITNYTDNGDGTVNVYSSILPEINDVIRIVGTSNPVDHEYTDNYDAIYTISDLGAGFFVITSTFYEVSSLITDGIWVYNEAAVFNTFMGFATGQNVVKGSRNYCAGYAVNPIDLNGNDQMNICDTIYGDLVNLRVGIGGKFVPEATIHNKGDYIQESLSADPSDPSDGKSVQWVSDGTESGDAGDVMIKITVGETTKTITLIDFSTY